MLCPRDGTVLISLLKAGNQYSLVMEFFIALLVQV